MYLDELNKFSFIHFSKIVVLNARNLCPFKLQLTLAFYWLQYKLVKINNYTFQMILGPFSSMGNLGQAIGLGLG